jgi:signal transduction histidine kinase
MKYTLKRRASKPFIYFKSNIVIKINNELVKLTGYSSNQLIGKSIDEINIMLRINSQINLEDIEEKHSCYIFTKEYEPREVNITCNKDKSVNEQIYYITEKINSRIEGRLLFLTSIISDDELAVSVYSIPNGILLKANKKYLSKCIENINGISKPINEVLYGYEGSIYEDFFEGIMKTGDPFYSKNTKYEYPEKRETYWDERFCPIYIKGELKYIVNTSNDVTEMVIGRNCIEKQKQELDVIIENISDSLMIINKDAEIIKINKSARDNITNDYKTANKLQDVFKFGEVFDMYGNLIMYYDLPFNRVIRGEKLISFNYILKNNKIMKYRELNGTPIYDSEGNFIAGVLIFWDIAEKLDYERSLYTKAQFESLNNIIGNLDLGFARFTYPEFNIIDINNKGYNQLKQIFPNVSSQSNIKSQSLFDIIDITVYIIDEMVQASLKSSRKSCFKICKYNIDQGELFVKWIYQPVFDLNGQIVEIIIIIGIDITEEIKDKEKMEKILKIQDEVYANVSHELKTPLNVIFSANQMMEIYLKNDLIEGKKEKLYHYNNIIKQNCYRLIKLLNNIVDLSKSNSGLLNLNLTNENIVVIVENIVQSVSDYVKSRELSIVFDTEVEEKIVACDPDMIERVMLNLISNAIKFSNPSGVIYVNVIDKGDVVEILVKDTGEGIEEKHLELIFQRFYQVDKSLSRNAEGTGIGLSLIKSIVELHCGNISVESEIDKGSTFKVELPVRIFENQKVIEQTNYMKDKIEMLDVEFSDIYSI